MAEGRMRCGCGGTLAREEQYDEGEFTVELVCLSGCARRYHLDGRPVRHDVTGEEQEARAQEHKPRGEHATREAMAASAKERWNGHRIPEDQRLVVGLRLRAAREAAGLSLTDVARSADIPLSSLQAYEVGRMNGWSLEFRIPLIAGAIGVSVETVMAGLAEAATVAAAARASVEASAAAAATPAEPATADAPPHLEAMFGDWERERARLERRRGSIAADPQQQRERALARQMLTGAVA